MHRERSTMAPPVPQDEEEQGSPAEQPVAAPPVFPLKRMIRFGSIVATILLSANALVCATVSCFFGLPG